MSKWSNAYVFSDKEARLPELIAGATTLGEKVTAILIGSESEAETAISHGADIAVVIAKRDGVICEDYVPTIAQIIQNDGNAGIVLLPAGKRGKCLAAKLGATLGGAVVNEAAHIFTDGDKTIRHLVYGGLANGTEKTNTPVTVVTIASGIFEGAAADSARRGEVKTAAFKTPARSIRLLGRHAKQGSTVDLGRAKRVVCVGRGIAKKEDITMAEELARVIEGDVGCSRPIAEGEGWMERERYVGVSGVMLKSDVYFALGVSGQIQHMVGANGSKIIIAVNKDKNAPIFNFVDYGIVGDIYKVIPSVIAALK